VPREIGPIPLKKPATRSKDLRLRSVCMCPECRLADPQRQVIWEADRREVWSRLKR
jgi:hypothetical protein